MTSNAPAKITQVTPLSISATVKEAVAEARKVRPTRWTLIKRWAKGLVCGVASFATCGCFCCGCCGRIRSPAVLYDEGDFDDLAPDDLRVVHGIQWCGLCGFTAKFASTCGLCCGCCGIVTPVEAVQCCGSNSGTRR